MAANPTGSGKAAKAEAAGPVRVRAKQEGFYGGQRIRKGTVFTIAGIGELGKWMEQVDAALEDQVAARHSPRKKRPGELPEGEVDAAPATRRAATDDDSVI
jgi:hypothetical protein